jgi:nucleoside-diphosphate kinase
VDRTLVLVKPDGVERGLIGEILSRFERRGLRLVAAQLRTLDRDIASQHYAEHVGKAFYDGLVDFITRGPVLALVIEGPSGTWQVVRTMMGPTDPAVALPGTIRGDLGIAMQQNLIHGSDSAESAKREIAIFFPALD